jgi:dephospho-CoA kinase
MPASRIAGSARDPSAPTGRAERVETDAPSSSNFQSLRHVLWIGGASASGKTSVATRLAQKYGLRLYSADTRTWEHRDRAIREGNAAAIRWERMTPAERAALSSLEMLELSLHRARAPMVVDDLQALPRSPLVVAEGTTLPASAVRDRARAAWLVATPEFQRAQLQERELSRAERDHYRLLGETIEREARERDVPVLVVDGDRGLDAIVTAVEERFADALAEGPLAETAAERRRLLREANEAIVGQVRGYYARPWAVGEADDVVRGFVCECGDRFCEATVEIAVGAAAAAPVLAGGHGSAADYQGSAK